MGGLLRYRITRQESSGGVIVRHQAGTMQVCLIIRRRDRHEVWGLPKGHIETGEQPHDTAVREVYEETGLRGDLLTSLGSISYQFIDKAKQTRYLKQVSFYLLRYVEGEARAQDGEVDDVMWLSLEEAMRHLSYDNERAILATAKRYLETNPFPITP